MINSPCVILAMSHLLLANICKEGVNFITLFNEPHEDARCIWKCLKFNGRSHEIGQTLTKATRVGEENATI
jgi:hypothetical protein